MIAHSQTLAWVNGRPSIVGDQGWNWPNRDPTVLRGQLSTRFVLVSTYEDPLHSGTRKGKIREFCSLLFSALGASPGCSCAGLGFALEFNPRIAYPRVGTLPIP